MSRDARSSWWPRLRAWAFALPACAALLACGGVGEEGTGVQPASASVGVLQGISDTHFTVNGVSYQRTTATTVTDGFGQPLGADTLRLGMWLEVLGHVDDTGAAGLAESIRVRPAARGVVTARGTVSLTVFDAEVLPGSDTVFEGASGTAGLLPGDLVEVHGPIGNAAGDVAASRIEKIASAQPVYELRGRVSQIDTVAKTLRVGRRAVSYANASVVLPRTGLVPGLLVRVAATAAPSAGVPWAVDRLTSDQALPANLGFLYTEGFVDGLAAGPLFQLDDLSVDATGANGKQAITADGQHVAAVGALVNGTLKAKSVTLIRPGQPVLFNLSGLVTEFESPALFKVRNVLIDASGASVVFVPPATVASIAQGAKLLVRGTISGRTLVATQVTLLPP